MIMVVAESGGCDTYPTIRAPAVQHLQRHLRAGKEQSPLINVHRWKQVTGITMVQGQKHCGAFAVKDSQKIFQHSAF